MTRMELTVDGRTLTLSNPDKTLWPEAGVTKRDLLRYAARVGPALLPHLRGRPLTVVRYPDGVTAHGFYQKDAPAHTPAWVRTYPVAADGGRIIRYILADDLATLLWLTGQAAVEWHPWLSRIEAPHAPDCAVIDLDPGPAAGFEAVRHAARLAKSWLDRAQLAAVPKTSGATGIHIIIPLAPVYSYAVTSRLVGLIARLMELEAPDLITTERTVKNRPPGAVYVDHLQNLPGKTIAAPYSPRPTPQATVSAPFPWSELAAVAPSAFTVTAPERVLRHAAWFTRELGRRQRLEDAVARLRSFGGALADER